MAQVSDTFPRYTLPVIEDPSEDPNGKPTFVADSFKIAVYLDAKYPAPNYPLAIPPGTQTLQKIFAEQFNNEVGFALVPIALPLIGTPGFLDEPGREHFIRTRTAWFGDLSKLLDTSPEKWAIVEEKWNKFGQAIEHNDTTSEAGPFVMGNQLSFADFVIGGFINWIQKVDEEGMPRWKRLSEWQSGRWERYWDELEKLGMSSTQVV
ncbi:Glutathione S-transferase, N-terminal domain, partial [Rhizoctonia solani]